MGRHQAVPQGSLRITAPVSYGESRIAPGERLHGALPQLEVTLNLTNQLLDLVHEGSIWRSAPATSRIRLLVARKLAQRVPHVCASRLHRPPRHARNSLRSWPVTPAWWATGTNGTSP